MNKIIYPLDKNWWYHWGTGARRRKPMSIAIAITGADGIVLAADSKESLLGGEMQVNNVHKITKIYNGVWLANVSNYAGFTNALVDNFVSQIEDIKAEVEKKGGQFDIRPVTKTFELWANTEYTKLRQDPQKTGIASLLENQIEFIFAGYSKEAIPKPYVRALLVRKELDLPPFTLQQNPYWVSGIIPIALYLLTKIDHIKPLTTINSNVLKMLAIMAYSETTNLTDLVGLPLEIITIKPNNQEEKITIGETEFKEVQTHLNTFMSGQVLLEKLAELQL